MCSQINMGYSSAAGGGSSPQPAARHIFMTSDTGRFGSHGKKKQWLAALGFKEQQYADTRW
jgi:hypothetical protein